MLPPWRGMLHNECTLAAHACDATPSAAACSATALHPGQAIRRSKLGAEMACLLRTAACWVPAPCCCRPGPRRGRLTAARCPPGSPSAAAAAPPAGPARASCARGRRWGCPAPRTTSPRPEHLAPAARTVWRAAARGAEPGAHMRGRGTGPRVGAAPDGPGQARCRALHTVEPVPCTGTSAWCSCTAARSQLLATQVSRPAAAAWCANHASAYGCCT